MNDTTKATLAGFLNIASILAGAGIIIAAANTEQLLAESNEYVVVFPVGSDVQGLDNKSAVRILGVDVGSVQEVAVSADKLGDPLVRVRFTLPIEHRLRRDAKITVQSRITGGAMLNIENLGPSTNPALAAGDELTGYTLSLGDVVSNIDSGIESFKTTSSQIQGLVSRVDDKVEGVVAAYHRVMSTADAALGNARDIMGDSKSDLRETFANVASLTQKADEQIPAAVKEARAFMAKAQASFDKIDPILEDGRAVTQQVRSMVNTNRAKVDSTLTNVQRASSEAKGAVAEIRRAPWRLMKEPDAKDQRNLELYETARRFADGANDLQAAAVSIQLAAADPNTEDAELDALRDELAKQIDSFVEIRQKLWDRFER